MIKKPQGYVILIHALATNKWWMQKITSALKAIGYIVINETYPSTKQTISEIAKNYLDNIIKTRCTNSELPIHFVTYSMGGIILREYLTHYNLPNLGKVVMIVPPNKGSELLDKFKKYSLLHYYFGPAATELSTSSIQKRNFNDNFHPGIIMGRVPDIKLLNKLLAYPNDLIITEESCMLNNMKDLIVLPYSHITIVFYDQTIYQIKYFLEHQCFDHS